MDTQPTGDPGRDPDTDPDDDSGGGTRRAPAGPGGPRVRRRRREHALWPAVSVVVAAVVYGLLPQDLLVTPRYVVPALEAALLVAMLATSRSHSGRRARVSRALSIALACTVIGTNLVALGLLVADLGSEAPGSQMLLGAMQVWVTGIIGFALLYWEIDRGGPVARHVGDRDGLPLADWRFSQDENDDAVGEVGDGASATCGWMPEFVDYLYLSVTNSSAFSPTDTMPLSARAKLLMALQSTAALLTSLLVVARAVGSLGGGGGG